MIELKHVSKSYGGKRALDDVNLKLPQGEIVGLFGENGAGKTTLMKCILGLLRCQGEITLDGQPITRRSIARLSFATSEHSFFPNLSPKSHMEFYAQHFPAFSEKRCQGADYILMDEPFAGNDVFNREDFYKVLLGILEPRETVLLSTHLIEEVSGFIGRAVLIRAGRIVGDVSAAQLEEEGRTLMRYIKETYHYQPDRVSRALSELTGEEEEP